MENNRVVFDTNVFISAVIGQFGYPYKIFNEMVLTGGSEGLPVPATFEGV